MNDSAKSYMNKLDIAYNLGFKEWLNNSAGDKYTEGSDEYNHFLEGQKDGGDDYYENLPDFEKGYGMI